MHIDPLSEVLSLLKPQTYIAGGLNLGSPWSLAFEAHTGIKCYAMISGVAWLMVEGYGDPLLLESGDCVLLPNGRRFSLSSGKGIAPEPFLDIPPDEWRDGFALVNGGGDALMFAGHFAFSGTHTDLLFGTMPPIIRLRDSSDKEGLRWALDRLRRELSDSKPGSSLVAQHLAHLMLVQALRIYISEGIGRGVGWLFALADPQMAKAVAAIHSQPGERWSLLLLAEKAGMSRTKFAARFKAITGTSPIDYLTRWRMLMACDRLKNQNEPISVIASSLGYDSDSAFSIAFKRTIGCSPSGYSKRLG